MKPFTLLIKPSGSSCNIDCGYCFYKDRPSEFGRGHQRMSDQVLETLIRDYMQLGFGVVGFAWQGGEPTLMGLDFFIKAVQLQKTCGIGGQEISNKLQTNGILLDDEWCRFLQENKFLLGISIDGPEEFHNNYRRDHSGKPTFTRVMNAIKLCQKYKVQFNALVVLNDKNVEHPDELFDFLIQNDLTYVQFIPCLESDPETHGPANFSITAEQYGRFLCRIFDRWCEFGPEKMNIRQFDSIVTHYVLGSHTICTFSEQCAGFLVVEHTGDCFPCEFFVEPEWRLGNILETPLKKIAADSRKRSFARAKLNLSNKCLICKYLSLCRGGCMKDRTRLGEEAQESYFCAGYKRFFDHATPRFAQIAAEVKAAAATRHTRAIDKVRWQIPDSR